MRRTALVAGAALLVGFAVVGTTKALSATETRRVALDDPTIVAIFDAANTADIETGALGAKKGTTKDIRDYGRMLSDVHTAVRQQGRDLAKKLGVTPTPPAGDQSAKDHAAAMQKLESLKGAAFDRAFLEHEQAYHAAVLKAVGGTLLPAIQNAELKKFVTDLAPAFEAHRLQAENLLKKVPAAN